MPAPWQSLAFTNKHPRDKHIVFDEPTHVYTIKGSSKGWTSCTGFIHSFFGHFDPDAIIEKMMKSKKWATSKYFGMSAEQIKAQWNANGAGASEKGTAMHLAIEQYYNGAEHLIPEEIKATKEWAMFMAFWNKVKDEIEPFRTEWEVYIEEIKLAGSIDGVFRRKSDGAILIYDWKRSKEIKMDNTFQTGLGPLNHLPDCNYWHYSLQLNIYRYILENYYGCNVADMYLVILHPDQKTFKRMKLNRMDEEVQIMMDCRRRAVEAGSKELVLFDEPKADNEPQVLEPKVLEPKAVEPVSDADEEPAPISSMFKRR
jgi:hypothetical protein